MDTSRLPEPSASIGPSRHRRRSHGRQGRLIAIAGSLVLGAAVVLGGASSVTAQSADPSITPAPTIFVTGPASVPPGVTLIRWFCCLGAGDAPEQVAVEQAVVDQFNASRSDIQIAFEGVPYLGARDALATEIASGNPPDIVGPVGIGGANAFGDQWLDLAPLITSTGYDLGQFQQGAVDFYKIGDQQIGIPFAIYPSELWYKRSMFEEINLAEPPHNYGDTYTMPDGAQVDWSYDTARQLGLMLTVDVNGRDATQEGFDPTQIVQYGFEPQRDDLRGLAASWQSGTLVAPDGKTVQIPDAWAASWKWTYDGIWKDHFIMTGPVFQRPEIAGGSGNPFCSGTVAMDINFLWSTYCLSDAGDDWDLAAVPSYDGQTTAAFNADTFRIMKGTQHPDQAFTVLTYLLGDASQQLLQVYGGFPARPSQQDQFFSTLEAGFTLQQPPDWQVAIDGVQFADNPNFESLMPHYNESLDILTTYQSKWTHTDGLDMDQEIPSLRSDLQAVWDK
jgi:multiple sugar transport system substrate-binding protein